MTRLLATLTLLTLTLSTKDGVAETVSVPPLTVEMIIEYGLRGSERVALLDAELITKDNAVLQSNAPLSTSVAAKASVGDNRFDTTGSPFSPERIKSDAVTVSARKLFETGTSIATELSHRRTDSEFPAAPGAAALTPTADYAESQGVISLKQSLWQNGLGQNFARSRASAELSASVQALNNVAAKEELALEYAKQFFQAWLAKAQWQAAQGQLGRQKRLLEVTRIKRSRGTAETPDVLQVETAVVNSEQSLADARKTLNDIWQALVISLNLPAGYLAIDPTTIEMRLGDGRSEAAELCRAARSQDEVKDTIALQAFRKLAEASSLSMTAAANQQAPDLYLEGRLAFNGIDEERPTTFAETAKAQHPQWSVAVGIEMKLDHFEEKARYLEAFKQKTLAELRERQLRNDLRIAWRRHCGELERLGSKLAAFEEVFAKQNRRSRLEGDRFRLAQVDVFNVIQAEADVITAELSLQRTKAALQTTVYEIKKLNDDFAKLLQARP